MRKAEEFLQQLIAQDSDAGACSITALAARAGVSYVTMWNAVGRLKAQGKLHGAYRVSVMPRPSEAAEPVSSPRDPLEKQFTRDLLDGAITRGPDLLSVKELTNRYGTSPATLRRVLHRCMEQEFLLPPHHSKGFGAR